MTKNEAMQYLKTCRKKLLKARKQGDNERIHFIKVKMYQVAKNYNL